MIEAIATEITIEGGALTATEGGLVTDEVAVHATGGAVEIVAGVHANDVADLQTEGGGMFATVSWSESS